MLPNTALNSIVSVLSTLRIQFVTLPNTALDSIVSVLSILRIQFVILPNTALNSIASVLSILRIQFVILLNTALDSRGVDILTNAWIIILEGYQSQCGMISKCGRKMDP